MPSDIEPRAAESTLVLLTRIEGTLNLVSDRVSNLTPRVDRHELEIGELKSTTQTLSEGAASAEKTAVALALALKEADETRRNKSEQEWTPFAKTALALGSLVGFASLYIQTKG